MRLVTGGETDFTDYFAMRLTAGGDGTGLTITDFDLSYTRAGAATAAKVDATALAAADSAHADNKMIEVDATDCPGLYRVDWPDAAFAAGAATVNLTVKHASCFTETLRVQIDGEVNVTKISGDSTAADNAEAFFDGTGYAGTNNVIPTVTTLTGHTAQTGDSFARIGAAGAGLTNIDLPNQTMDIVGSITGNLSGSVGSVTGAVGSVTGAVGSVTGNVGGDVQGNVDGSVASVAGAVGSVTGAVGSVTGAVGSVTGNVGGNVVGSVGSVTGAVGSVTAEVSADMTKISGSATAADNLEASALGVFKGAATSNGTTTTLIDTTLGARDDTWIGRTVVITGGTLVNEATDITDYDQATKTLTFTALTGSTTSGDTYVIV